jgi:hypothetical protein
MKKIYGVGINDATYRTREHVIDENGKRKVVWRCPYYALWSKILYRCYSESFHAKQPTYKNVVMAEDWLVFSNFKKWMMQQDWEGKEIDKDILGRGLNIYSEETCMFVPHNINMFVVSLSEGKANILPLGVSFDKSRGKYRAQVGMGARRNVFLGYFSTPEEAHKAWQLAKWKYGRELLSEQTDPRVIQAMHVILHKLGEDWSTGRITEKLV